MGVMLGDGCIGCARQCNGAEEQGAVRMVGIRGKLASGHGLGRYAMLQGGGCPKGGVCVGIVE